MYTWTLDVLPFWVYTLQIYGTLPPKRKDILGPGRAGCSGPNRGCFIEFVGACWDMLDMYLVHPPPLPPSNSDYKNNKYT